MNITTAHAVTARPSPAPAPGRRLLPAALLPLALLVATPLALLVATVSCDKADSKDAKAGDGKAAPAGGLAVGYVDLKDLARQLRWDTEIETKLNAGRADLDRQRESFERQIARALEEKNRQVAAAAKMNEQQTKELMTVRDAQSLERLLPNKALRDDLLRTHANAGELVNRARGARDQVYGQWYGEVQRAYVDALRPIIRQVAEANGVKSVMTKVDVVIYVEPSADLTNKVVDEAQKRSLAVTIPDAPKLQLPNVELANPPPPATGPAAAPPSIGPTTRGAPAMPPIGPATPPR